MHEQLSNSAKQAPCGYEGHSSGLCHCSPDLIRRYKNRVSGPLLDRIDIQIEVAPVDPEVLAAEAYGESSLAIAARVQVATDVQLRRQGKRNQYLTTREIDQLCKPDKPGKAVLKQSMETFHWSGRAYHRILRVSRTIADMAGSERILEAHISEAIQYRRALRDV